ncbi:hypothetical protein P9955_27685, partial [Serratia nevei]|nr:hypothetical protein [Serratia nevei]MDK5270970.1 hypothetical protein [Serratia nevei]MDK5276292.1 hypothetical protein [Serratia nevei]
IGAMKARVGLKKGDAPTVARREKREKKDRQPDPRFPRAGHPWQEDEKTLLSDALDSVPDEEIGKHLFWLSEKLGRTPFSVAFQIAAIRELQDGWEEQFRGHCCKVSDEAAFCLIQRPYISKTLLTRRIS